MINFHGFYKYSRNFFNGILKNDKANNLFLFHSSQIFFFLKIKINKIKRNREVKGLIRKSPNGCWGSDRHTIPGTIANGCVSAMVARTVANGFVTALVAGTVANGLGLW